MTRHATWLLVTALVLAGSPGHGAESGSLLRIHQGSDIDEHAIAEIDSITFFESAVPLVNVPAGTFAMGDGWSFCGLTERTVTLTHPFHLGQYEVTNRQYRDALQWAYDQGLVTATPEEVSDHLDGSTIVLVKMYLSGCQISFSGGTFTVDAGKEDHPMVMVTWCGAAAYCDWISLKAGFARAYDHATWTCNGGDPYGAEGYRLPTDAEHEFAAQYDDERRYPWGNEAPDCSRANFADDCVGTSSPVGSYPAAPSSLGLFDMAGNADEWCNDWYVCTLAPDPVTDPTGPASGTYRVKHGGSYLSPGIYLPCSVRGGAPPPLADEAIGFRVARTQ